MAVLLVTTSTLGSPNTHRFTDFMVRDTKTGECYRADHLLEGALEAIIDNVKEPAPAEVVKVSQPLDFSSIQYSAQGEPGGLAPGPQVSEGWPWVQCRQAGIKVRSTPYPSM
jgi:hypothetical protein